MTFAASSDPFAAGLPGDSLGRRIAVRLFVVVADVISLVIAFFGILTRERLR